MKPFTLLLLLLALAMPGVWATPAAVSASQCPDVPTHEACASDMPCCGGQAIKCCCAKAPAAPAPAPVLPVTSAARETATTPPVLLLLAELPRPGETLSPPAAPHHLCTARTAPTAAQRCVLRCQFLL
jgi:hypothetical protein